MKPGFLPTHKRWVIFNQLSMNSVQTNHKQTHRQHWHRLTWHPPWSATGVSGSTDREQCHIGAIYMAPAVSAGEWWCRCALVHNITGVCNGYSQALMQVWMWDGWLHQCSLCLLQMDQRRTGWEKEELSGSWWRVLLHLFSLLAEGMSPAVDAAHGSFLACHQFSSDWSTTSSTSPRLNAIPASGQGIEVSCRGQ